MNGINVPGRRGLQKVTADFCNILEGTSCKKNERIRWNANGLESAIVKPWRSFSRSAFPRIRHNLNAFPTVKYLLTGALHEVILSDRVKFSLHCRWRYTRLFHLRDSNLTKKAQRSEEIIFHLFNFSALL